MKVRLSLSSLRNPEKIHQKMSAQQRCADHSQSWEVTAMYDLAIDLGSTGCRSILFDETLHLIADEYREYGLITPKEKWVEQDAELWWSLTVKTAKRVLEKAGVSKQLVRGISISSQGITIVPVDEGLHPLYNAISWLDVRADAQVREIETIIPSRELFTLTGKRNDSAYTLPKLLWLRDNKPEIFERAQYFLMPMDFLIGKLTGKVVTDHTMASGTLFYDIHNHRWCDQLLALFGIPKEKLPSLLWSGECVGTVLPEVAKQIGVSESCVVAVGAQDQKCAALGAGLQRGTMTVSLGTAAAVEKLWTEARTECDTRIGWSGYVKERTWVTEGVLNTAASVLRWLRDTLFPGESYDTINLETEEAMERNSSLLCYPYLNGPSSPNNYPESDGCFYGVNLATKRGDFAMAVMEGVAFQLRILLEAMDAYSSVNRLVLFGGGSKSDLWCRIIANITGMEITIPETAETAAAGAAILSGIACGAYDREEHPCVQAKKTYPPEEAKQKHYEEKYLKYRKIERKLWNDQDEIH